MKHDCRILLTGAAGAIGRVVAPALREAGHWVRSFDRAPAPCGDERLEGDLAEPADLHAAAEGVDTIVHLAANPSPAADFLSELHRPNVLGAYNVFDAARTRGVERVVLASSVQVALGRLMADGGPVSVDAAAPINMYGLTKIWVEQLGEMQARQHGLSVLAARLGWFPHEPPTPEAPQSQDAPESPEPPKSERGEPSYISPADAARFFQLAVTVESIDYAVVYAVGRGAAGGAVSPYDLRPGRTLLGFEPRDAYPQWAAER